MIPKSIQLKNFLSYGSALQKVDFAAYQLICLSGKNGHGKSALLEAMTWTLWGQARKVGSTSKPDDGLLRLGQTHMMVIFEFECNGQLYRVKREYAHSYGKPYASLEFGVFSPNDNAFHSLTDKTIRTTQEKIEKTIGITFDSFVNSIFLRQGNANEFSKKSPRDRKEILASILNLDRYETLRKKALDAAKEQTTAKNGLILVQERIDAELQQSTELNQQLQTVSTELTALATQEQKIKTELTTLSKKQSVLETKRNNLAILTFRAQEVNSKEQDHRQALRSLVEQWRSIQRNLTQLTSRDLLERQKKELVAAITTHQKKLQEQLHNKEETLKVKEQLHLLEARLRAHWTQELNECAITVERHKTQTNNLHQKHTELVAKEAELAKKRTQLEQEKKALLVKQINLDTKAHEKERAQFEKRKEFYQKFQAQGSFLHNELKALLDKKKVAHDSANPSCPLCEQHLSASRKQYLKSHFERLEQLYKHRINRLARLTKELKTVLIEQHTQLNSFTTKQEEQVALATAANTFEKDLNALAQELTAISKAVTETATQLAQTAAEHNNALAILEKKRSLQQHYLHENKEFQELEAQMNSLLKHQQAIQYNSTLHNQTASQLQNVEQQLDKLHALQQQALEQNERKKRVHEQCTMLKRLAQEKQELHTQMKPFATLATEETTLTTAVATLETELHSLTRTKETILEQKGRLNSLLQKREQQHKEYTANKKKLLALNEAIEDYQTIATATSKDGIQALLIEEAIPELEHETNAILAQLTHNEAHVLFESLRDLKKGGTKETLDIKISDNAGIRPYELFSGGEAFKIDFAIRIAISKLLARRAGTSLQTLIIDEGFGSQDEESLGYLMDALYSIQNDFSKIIVVSHLPIMKDQFPVHFAINKGPNGSVVTVVEQG